MNRIILILSLLFVYHIYLPVLVNGQTGNSFDQFKDDISDKLPPLSVLIDSAIVNNANVQYKDQQLIINECKLRAKRVEWTRNFGLQANTGYGNLYNYTSSTTGGIDPIPTTSNRSQSQYNAAVYINMPINLFVDRKNQIKIAKIEIEQAQSLATAQRDELRQQIILQYNDLILKQRLFKIKVKNLETVKINMQMVEKQFLNGIVTITDYTRMLGDVAGLETDFEKARMDFVTSYMILEVIVGMKFHLVKTIPETYDHN
ncbi:MAG: TolC family protein [Bacteroidota bacterium]